MGPDPHRDGAMYLSCMIASQKRRRASGASLSSNPWTAPAPSAAPHSSRVSLAPHTGNLRSLASLMSRGLCRHQQTWCRWGNACALLHSLYELRLLDTPSGCFHLLAVPSCGLVQAQLSHLPLVVVAAMREAHMRPRDDLGFAMGD